MSAFENKIEEMKVSRRLWLPGVDQFWHYVTVWISLSPVVVIAYRYFFKRNAYESLFEVFMWCLFWIVLAGLLYLLQRKRLTFSLIDIAAKPSDFKEAAEAAAKYKNWDLYFVTDDVWSARSKPGNSMEGERITAIRTKDHILINSICEPYTLSLASWGRNYQNRVLFEIFLKEYIKKNQQVVSAEI